MRKSWYLQIPRVERHACGLTRQVPIDFAEPRRRYTHAFERYALELSRHMTIKDVAEHLGVGWDTIQVIQQRHRKSTSPSPSSRTCVVLAIQKISVGKGHRYLTVVLDPGMRCRRVRRRRQRCRRPDAVLA